MMMNRIFCLLVGVLLCGGSCAIAQDRNLDLFREDMDRYQEQRTQQKRQIVKSYQKPQSNDLKIRGDSIEFAKDGQTLLLRDRVVASSEGFSIQAGGAEVDVEQRKGSFYDGVVLNHPEFSVSCQEAYLDMPYELGVFKKANFRIEEVELLAEARSLIKYSEFGYRLYDSSVTTCDTDLSPLPWEIFSDSLDITQEGYAYATWAGLSFYGVPLFYTPYMGFPVKQERSSGLLMPSIGYNSQNGVQVWLPLHVVLDDATDFTVTPFLETNNRYGGEFEFRKAFSQRHSLESRWLYSDETPRGDELRGLQAREDGVLPFDSERFGGFYSQDWQSDPESDVVSALLADVHYVSDDLLLRELEDPDVGFRNTNFLTSRLVGRLGLGSWGAAEAFAEYNQAIDLNFASTDDAMLQRLPEVSVRLARSLRPFGFNPYGLKLVGKTNVTMTEFAREVGVDGTRININPEVAVPFHYQNYFSGGVGLSYLNTSYKLNDVGVDEQGVPFSDSPSRSTYIAGANVSTVLEKVYDVADDSLLASVAGLGLASYADELKRVKHQIEPFVRYDYVPDVDQDNLPLFDSLDRIRNRSLVTYGVTNRFLGKRESIRAFRAPIEELTPSLRDLPQLDTADSVVNLGLAREAFGVGRAVAGRSGRVESLAQFSVLQSYDLIEAADDLDPIREPFSDVNVRLDLTPNASFQWSVATNYSPERSDFSSWNTTLSAADDRGDVITARYSLVSPQVLSTEGLVVDGEDISNIDGQLELVLTDRLKLGYFARYDGTAGEFIDQVVGLRVANGCNCWAVDIGYSDRTNPDRRQLLLKFNLNGLGQLQQSVLYSSIREGLRSF